MMSTGRDFPSSLSFRYARYEAADPPRVEDGQTVVFGCDLPKPKKVVVVLEVSEPGWGFGEVTFIQTEDGLSIDSELSGPDAVKRWLCALVDSAVLDTDTDPERHQLQMKIEGSSGHGPACRVCHPVNT